MSLRAYRTFQALILAGLGLGLLAKVVDGRVLLYINQRFVILALLAALGMLILAQLVMRERPPENAPQSESGRSPWGLWLTALPLLVGLLVPERALGASAIETRGIYTSFGRSARDGAGMSAALPSTQRSVLDWVRIFGESEDMQASQLATYAGQEADVSGFVAHDSRYSSNQFLVGRFTISCCVADASALGMLVDWPEAAGLPVNRWVRVRGPLRVETRDGKPVPVIEARQVEAIPEPPLPYLFP